jgi:predicted peptidase
LIPASVFIGEKLNNLVEDKFLDLQYIDKSGKVLPYRLYVPDINSSKYYPLILFLHGAGERGSDNKLQLMANRGAIVWAEDVVQTEHPCFVLAPQCPQTSSWTELLTSGDPFKSTPYLDMVYELILDIEKKYNNIDKRRIYSTGLSMGGFGTWTINIAHPKVFTAIVPICGGGDPAKANLLVNKPIWAFHSEDDPVVDVAFSRNMVNALKKLGSNVKYTEYDKGVVAPPLAPMAHFSWVPAYNDQDMIEWLFLQ